MTSPSVEAPQAREAGPFRIQWIRYAPGLVQPPHAHQGASVTLLLSGAIREQARGREVTGASLSVVVKPPGVRHADEVGPEGARTLQITLGAGTFRELTAERGPEAEWRWLHGGRASGPLLELAGALRRRTTPASELEDRALEALSRAGTASEGRRGPTPSWVARVKEALDDDPFGDRSVRECARLVDVHPVSLSRAFRREYGVTITEYRRRSRLRRAAALIASGDESLSRAAHAAGYADHPHLCRDFRDFLGMSPSEFRRLAAG